MELVPHLWAAFKKGPIDVVMEYHRPVTIREIGNRKALANYCEACCRIGLARALTGRHVPGPEEAAADQPSARPTPAAAVAR